MAAVTAVANYCCHNSLHALCNCLIAATTRRMPSATADTVAATFIMPYVTVYSAANTRSMPSATAVTAAATCSMPYVTVYSAAATRIMPSATVVTVAATCS